MCGAERLFFALVIEAGRSVAKKHVKAPKGFKDYLQR